MLPWVDKYRSRDFSHLYENDIKRKFITNLLDKEIYPCLILYGSSGTGKTTFAKNICRYIHNDCMLSVLELNASHDRGINVIRKRIHTFVNLKRYNGKPKIIILDEADSMTVGAQDAMHMLLDTCNKKCTSPILFIFTCNSIYKLNNSIRSYSIIIHFDQLSDTLIHNKLHNICTKEEVHIEDNVINNIIANVSGDMRAAINTLHHLSIYGNNQVTEDISMQWLGMLTLDNIDVFLDELLLSEHINDRLAVVDKYIDFKITNTRKLITLLSEHIVNYTNYDITSSIPNLSILERYTSIGDDITIIRYGLACIFT